MKQRPILFSTPMVQAILQGNKTMTRRIIKPQTDDRGLWDDDKFPRSIDSKLTGFNGTVDETGESKEFKCPYGKVGDVLWVRETWSKKFSINGDFIPNQYVFKSTNDKHEGHFTHEELGLKWKPSIHMPKEACRIWLEITNIRIERLQQISSHDAQWEGMVENGQPFIPRYEELWNKINGKYSWNDNPWVWVIEFKQIERSC